MKFFKFFLVLLVFIINSCKKNDDFSKLRGTIQVQGITTYMYGTHVLTNDLGQTLYALRSKSLELDDYVGQSVEISGSKVQGNPVDGGPDFLEVSEIK